MTAIARRRPRLFRVPANALGPRHAPFASVVAERHPQRMIAAIVIALSAHLAVGVWAGSATVAPRPVAPRMTPPVTIERKVRPAPVPPPEPPPAPVEPAPKPVAAPPSPARAGKVVARAESANEPADFTGFDIVQGTSTYVGGATSAKGQSDIPVRAAQVAVTSPPHASLARLPSVSRQDWACEWPSDEDVGEVREVRVTIAVHVTRDGAPEVVDVLGSAAPAFAQAARHCAFSEHYESARDDAGNRVAGVTPSFIVHFFR